MGGGDVFPDHVGGEHDNVYALVETLRSCQVAGPLGRKEEGGGRGCVKRIEGDGVRGVGEGEGMERVCEEERGR